MRFIAVFPALLMCAATILAIFCILAGYNSTFLEGFEILTFNTSLVGAGVVAAAAPAIVSQLPTALQPLATETISIPSSVATYIPAAIESAIESELSGLTPVEILQNIAQTVGIHDFYKLHILNYCEGYYEPGPIPTAENPNPSQNVTRCSPAQAFSFFNATEVLLNETAASGIPFERLNFPSEVQDAVNAMAIAQKAMFVLYCIGAGLSGVSALLGLLAILVNGRLSSVCNSILDLFAFVALAVASALATAFMVIVINAVNEFGAQISLQAYRGTNFLIITWIATALTLIASILWCIDCCVGPSRRRKTEKY